MLTSRLGLKVARMGAMRAGVTGAWQSRQAGTGKPTVKARAKEMYDISKEHVKKAAKNQAQAMEDVTQRGTSASKVYPEHMKEAGADMKQWGSELRQAAAGDLPGQSKTRDLPPMEPGEEHVQDRVTVQETSAGESQRKAPSTTP